MKQIVNRQIESRAMNRMDPATPDKQLFRIEGMHCGSCVARIEQGLKQTFPELTDVRVNLATGQALLEGPVSPQAVLQAIEQMGYQASMPKQTGRRDLSAHGTASVEVQAKRNNEVRRSRTHLLTAIGLTVPLFAMHMGGWHFPGSGWVQFALASVVLFYCGQDIFRMAWQMLKRRDSNMDTLIALGSGVAWLYSTVLLLQGASHQTIYFETAAMIVTLILLGRYLEAGARRRAGEAIEGLMQLQPATALLLRDGVPVEVPVQEVTIGERILVRPGSTIPLDGMIQDGETSVNEAMMTGESLPVSKNPGDAVIGGTLNQTGAITVQVTHVGADTMLSRMVELVEKAQTGKPAVQRLADKIAGAFVPMVLVLAAMTVAGWVVTGHSWADGLTAAIAVLVIACPCALGLATPTAVQAGLGRAAKEGILIQDTDGLEQAHKLDMLVMDKTGTLTLGKPTVQAVSPLAEFSEDDCLRWAAALEARSEHPLGSAIVKAADQRQMDWHQSDVANFTSRTGAGVMGTVEGRRILIGKPSFLAEQGVNTTTVFHKLDKASQKGQTPVLMAVNGKAAGVFLLADPLKPDAAEAIQRLRDMGIKPYMLSGDRKETAQAIGKQAGLTEQEIRANMNPQEKLEFLKDLQRDGDHPSQRRTVGMLGDGINDAPALAQADVSIAMGSGTDIAMQAAQITLVHGDIARAVDAVQLSRAIFRVIRQNLFWAFFYNLLAIPAAALGLLNPIIAAAVMSLSSVTVVLNSLRLRSMRF